MNEFIITSKCIDLKIWSLILNILRNIIHEHVFYNIILTGVVSFRLFRVCNRILSIIFSSPFSPYIPLLKTDTHTKLRDTGSFVMEDIWIIKLKIVDIACFWYNTNHYYLKIDIWIIYTYIDYSVLFINKLQSGCVLKKLK